MTSTLVSLFFVVVFGLFAMVIVFLFVEVLAALLSRTQYELRRSSESRPVTTVLIPAHNEESGIVKTLEAIKLQLLPHDQLLVVADNCSDMTAKLARTSGATVIERNDLGRRGKGYALDFGIAFLKKNHPEIVVACDADITLGANALEKLIWKAYLLQKPAQGKYLLKLPGDCSPRTHVSAFAFLFKNFVRPLGLSRLGGGCLLTGTGMAFPWDLIKDAPLASGNIVEDMQLGIDLAIAGNTPVFCPDVEVISDMAPDTTAERTQRKRWEHGHILTMRSQVRRLFVEALKQRRHELLLLGLELAVPPLASLVLLWSGLFCIVMILTVMHILPISLFISFAFLALLLLITIVSGWFRFGREMLPLKHIIVIPFYILYKTPIYMSFLIKPKKEWVRTSRDNKNQ